MHKYLSKKSTILLIIATLFVFVQAFEAIVEADFIQAFSLKIALSAHFKSFNPHSGPNSALVNQYIDAIATNSNISSNITALVKLEMPYFILSFIFLILIGMVSGALGAIFSAKSVTIFINKMRLKTYEKIQKLSLQDLDRFSTSSLVTRITTDSEVVNSSYSFTTKFLTYGVFTFIFGLIVSVINYQQYSIVYAYLLPFIILFLCIVMYFTLPYFKKGQISTDQVNNAVRDSILGIRVVKAYNLEEKRKKEFEIPNDGLKKSNQKAFSLLGLMMPVVTFVVSATAIVIYLIGYNKYNDLPSVSGFSNIIGFSNILLQVLFGFIVIITTFAQIGRAVPSSKRILEIEKYEPSIKFNNDSKLKINNGKIEFKNVSYSYLDDKNKCVIKNINFVINPKEKIGIIGNTGSGKTTIVNLIGRLFDPIEGDILIDNENIKNYSFNEINSSIGIAMQNALLFSGTVASNIGMGLSDEEFKQDSLKEQDSKIIEAAKIAEAWEFIQKKPDGINSIVEQRGKNFSGGQKQRISIARTIAKKSKIIIFDDSTSALDTVTEQKVQKNIKEFNDTTTIIIAQRISSVENLDKIIVLDSGKIVGFDNHWNLLKDNEYYRLIVASQLGTEELNEILISRGINPIIKNNNI